MDNQGQLVYKDTESLMMAYNQAYGALELAKKVVNLVNQQEDVIKNIREQDKERTDW